MKIKRDFILKVIKERTVMTREFLYYDVIYNPTFEYENQGYYRLHCIYRRDDNGNVERIGVYDDRVNRV